MADQIKVEILSEYKDDGAKEALEDAEKIESLKPEFEVDADVSKVLSAFDEVVSETKSVQAAADALGNALGPELSAKADTTEIVRQLQAAGLEIDTIIANADQLAGKLREVSDADVGGKLGASLGTARGKTDELTDSAVKGRSALANMIGNTAQDLGAMGGIAGSAGVALGQMAEGAADAAAGGEAIGSALKGMAMVAGPVAALTIGVQLLQMWMSRGKAEAKEIAEATEQYADALFKAQDAGEDLQNTIEKTAQSQVDKFIKDLSDDTADFADALDVANVSYDDLIRAFARGDGKLVSALRRYEDISEEIRQQKALMGETFAIEDYARKHGLNEEAFKREWEALKTLNDEIGNNVDVSNEAIANAQAAASIREREVSQYKLSADAIAALNTQMERYVEGLEQRHDEAERQERVNQQYEVAKDKLTRLNVEAERVDRARLLRQERDAANDVTEAYEEMHRELSDRRSLLQLQQDFDDLRTKAEQAWTASAEGAEDAEQKQRDYQIAQIDTINNALEYIATVESIPDKAVTDVEALIDQQKYNEALRMLEILSQPRSAELTIHLDELAIQRQIRRAYANAGLPSAGPVSMPVSMPTATAAPMVVNVNMPRGSRGVDVLRQVSHQARRSGRRYGVPVSHYARRPA